MQICFINQGDAVRKDESNRCLAVGDGKGDVIAFGPNWDSSPHHTHAKNR